MGDVAARDHREDVEAGHRSPRGGLGLRCKQPAISFATCGISARESTEGTQVRLVREKTLGAQAGPLTRTDIGPMEPTPSSGFVDGFMCAVAELVLTSEDGRPLFSSNTLSGALEQAPTLYQAPALRVNVCQCKSMKVNVHETRHLPSISARMHRSRTSHAIHPCPIATHAPRAVSTWLQPLQLTHTVGTHPRPRRWHCAAPSPPALTRTALLAVPLMSCPPHP